MTTATSAPSASAYAAALNPLYASLSLESSSDHSPIDISGGVGAVSAAPSEASSPGILVLLLPDGSRSLALTAQSLKDFEDEAARASLFSQRQEQQQQRRQQQQQPQQHVRLGGGVAVTPADALMDGMPLNLQIFTDLSPEAHAAVTLALTSEASVEELRALGYDLASSGWLTLPQPLNSQRVFLPSYLASQELAIRVVRRSTDQGRLRELLRNSNGAARVVRSLALVHILLAVLNVLGSHFVGIAGLFAVGGFLGARYGRAVLLVVYLGFVLFDIIYSCIEFAGWAAAAQDTSGGAEAVFGDTSVRMMLIFTIISATASVAAVVCVVRLLVLLRALHALGWGVASSDELEPMGLPGLGLGSSLGVNSFAADANRTPPVPPLPPSQPVTGSGGSGPMPLLSTMQTTFLRQQRRTQQQRDLLLQQAAARRGVRYTNGGVRGSGTSAGRRTLLAHSRVQAVLTAERM